MNRNINSEIEVTLLQSYDGNRQSIGWRSHRRSNKISNEGDSPVYTINRQLDGPPEAAYRDMHWEVYQEVDSEVYQEVDQDSTDAACWERNLEVDRMVTEADIKPTTIV